MRLRVGGLTLAVRSRRPTTALGLEPEFQPFLVSRGADISLELREEPLPVLPSTPPLFDSGGVWCVYEEPGGRFYLFATPVLSPPCYKAVRIDSALRKGTLFFPRSSSDGPRHALDFPLDELLFQHRLANDGALEVHACGVVVDGRAVLFLGQSGAGKSTLARLWCEHRPAVVLSDDRIVLRRHGRGFRAHGTPWHGEGGLAAQGSARLGAIFFIRHQTENVTRPLARARGHVPAGRAGLLSDLGRADRWTGGRDERGDRLDGSLLRARLPPGCLGHRLGDARAARRSRPLRGRFRHSSAEAAPATRSAAPIDLSASISSR